MEPYYLDDQVTLFHGDCLDIGVWLDADVLVTDPPYGIDLKQRLGRYQTPGNCSYVEHAVRGDTDEALRDAALAAWGATRPAMVFGSWRTNRPIDVRSVLIWHKDGAAPGPCNAAFFTNHEEICVTGEGWRKSSPPLRSVITTTEHRSTATRAAEHPTPKPVGLMEKLIGRCPLGVIADPFAGSGSTLVAARNLSRKSIGVEIEERYCELIAKRLNQMCLDFREGA